MPVKTQTGGEEFQVDSNHCSIGTGLYIQPEVTIRSFSG